MNVHREERGLALLAAHCASLDPASANARERLEATLGEDLAHRLVVALSWSAARELGARPVFAS